MAVSSTQSHAIRSYLLAAMKEGEYAGRDHLPPEKELSEALNISRTQLRDALSALEREGFITRRHGVGTIINHHVLAVRCRMDIEIEFLDMIRQNGFTPAIRWVRTEEGPAGEAAARKLDLDADSPVLRVARLCTADGTPAIYCEDVIPTALLREGYAQADLQQPIFRFLQEYADRTPYLDVTDLRPVVADEALADIFETEPGVPLLNMEETDYAADGTPVFVSSQYFADGFFRHTVLRKKF